MASLGTIEFGAYTNVSNTATNGSDPLLESISSADDTDYVYDNANNNHTGQADFALDNMPSDFGNMNSAEVRLRYAYNSTSGANNTWDNLQAQILTSSGGSLSDNVNIATNIVTSTITNSTATTLTNVSTTANKATWDGAVCRISWVISRNKGGDSNQERVYAAELTGDYDIQTGTAGAVVFRHYRDQKK